MEVKVDGEAAEVVKEASLLFIIILPDLPLSVSLRNDALTAQQMTRRLRPCPFPLLSSVFLHTLARTWQDRRSSVGEDFVLS